MEAVVDHDLQFLRSWFERPKMGSFPLLGLDRKSWDPENEKDLVALAPRRAPDHFSHWFINSFMPAFHGAVADRFNWKVRLAPASLLLDH
jgi:hypothetical protein